MQKTSPKKAAARAAATAAVDAREGGQVDGGADGVHAVSGASSLPARADVYALDQWLSRELGSVATASYAEARAEEAKDWPLGEASG